MLTLISELFIGYPNISNYQNHKNVHYFISNYPKLMFIETPV